jgi:hypothetical protein
MTLGDAMNIVPPFEGRASTVEERKLWMRATTRYYGRTTRRVRELVITAEVCSYLQNKTGVPLIGRDSEQKIAQCVEAYNRLGRCLIKSLSNEYVIVSRDNDIHIYNPNQEGHEGDRPDVSQLGAAIILGVIVVAGVIALCEILDTYGQNQRLEFQKRILEMDDAKSRAPKEERDAWLQARAVSAEIARQTGSEDGFWGRLKQGASRAAAIVGAVAVGAVGLGIVYHLMTKQR